MVVVVVNALCLAFFFFVKDTRELHVKTRAPWVFQTRRATTRVLPLRFPLIFSLVAIRKDAARSRCCARCGRLCVPRGRRPHAPAPPYVLCPFSPLAVLLSVSARLTSRRTQRNATQRNTALAPTDPAVRLHVSTHGANDAATAWLASLGVDDVKPRGDDLLEVLPRAPSSAPFPFPRPVSLPAPRSPHRRSRLSRCDTDSAHR